MSLIKKIEIPDDEVDSFDEPWEWLPKSTDLKAYDEAVVEQIMAGELIGRQDPASRIEAVRRGVARGWSYLECERRMPSARPAHRYASVGAYESAAEKQRAYREANRDEIAEKKRAWREANRDEIAEKNRARAVANGADPLPGQARAWARSQGIEVGQRGRVKPELIAQYLAAKEQVS